MVPSDYTVSALATLMSNEPKDDLLLGYTLCGLVIRNRVLAGWEGGNWLRLIQKHDIYSACPPDSPRALVFGDPDRDNIFRRCLGVADSIYNGREKDITEGALWYGRLDKCSDWFKENIVRPQLAPDGEGFTLQAHPMVAKIGLQMCFK